MEAKKDRRDSQELFFEPKSENFIGSCMDFAIMLEEQTCDENIIQFTKMVQNDEECIQQWARIQAYRARLIASIFPVLDDDQKKMITDCHREEDEYIDMIKSMGNIVMYDQTTVQKAEDKDR